MDLITYFPKWLPIHPNTIYQVHLSPSDLRCFFYHLWIWACFGAFSSVPLVCLPHLPESHWFNDWGFTVWIQLKPVSSWCFSRSLNKWDLLSSLLLMPQMPLTDCKLSKNRVLPCITAHPRVLGVGPGMGPATDTHIHPSRHKGCLWPCRAVVSWMSPFPLFENWDTILLPPPFWHFSQTPPRCLGPWTGDSAVNLGVFSGLGAPLWTLDTQ